MAINISMKNVSVEFRDIHRDEKTYSIDTTPFNNRAYNEIKTNGHILTDLNLIHCATIHYQTRFQTNLSRRFRCTLDTIEPSMLCHCNGFFFDELEESELQKISSEVIGVGFAISLFQKLLDVNFNCINRIPARGRRKRCDFEIVKNGQRFVLESKGRKNGLNSAINQIIDQKSETQIIAPKYGSITMIPRNGQEVSMCIVDPLIENDFEDDDSRLIKLLIYYTQALQLAGYHNLARILNHRIDEILRDNGMIFEYRNKAIDYEKTLKAGYDYEFALGNNIKFSTFISRNSNVGLTKSILIEHESYLLLFGLDTELITLLERQDFDRLLNYNIDTSEMAFEESNMISIHNDGTILYSVPKSIITY